MVGETLGTTPQEHRSAKADLTKLADPSITRDEKIKISRR
jgi:hypothetical protein